MGINVGDYFLSPCAHKISPKHVFDFEHLPSYVRLNLRREGRVTEKIWNKNYTDMLSDKLRYKFNFMKERLLLTLIFA